MSRVCIERGEFFFFNDTATTEIYALSLHDALPICPFVLLLAREGQQVAFQPQVHVLLGHAGQFGGDLEALLGFARSEEHTSELQSRQYLVCRLLLEKKKTRSLSLHCSYLAPALAHI